METAADCLHGECMWFSQPDASGPSSSDPIALIPGEPTVNDAAFVRLCIGGAMRVFSVLRDIDVSFEKCMLLLKSMYVYLSICYMLHINRPCYKKITC